MNFIVLVAFVVGCLLGGGVGVYWAKRTAPVSVFEEDTEEADELRAEAQHSVNERIEKRKNRIVATAQAKGTVTNDEVEDLFCISNRTAGRYLQQLTDAKLLTKVGTSGRGVHYVLTT